MEVQILAVVSDPKPSLDGLANRPHKQTHMHVQLQQDVEIQANTGHVVNDNHWCNYILGLTIGGTVGAEVGSLTH